MSTTSSVAPNSRSSSPMTPDEPSDCLEPVSILSDLDQTFSDWYLPIYPAKAALPRWAADQALYTTPHKVEEEHMLHLDELIEQHAYEDSPPSEIRSAVFPPRIPAGSPVTQMESDLAIPNLVVPPNHSIPSIAKPVPPPVTIPRKPDLSSSNQTVVFPPKEVCFNLPIFFPSIPEGGTKSRVETQVRVTVDLAQSCSSSESGKYDKVGSWKWLKLPHGTATKRRTRKQGKIDPEPEDILYLTAAVTCSTPPHNPVLSCSSCQTREAKRVAKKLAARVRPARSESESDGHGTGKVKSKSHEDTTSIIQFNCAETLEFSTGSVILPLRITCYCRHHREKVGFNVHFSMMDHLGRIVGTGMTKPIMITDDHKTTSANKAPEVTHNLSLSEHPEWPGACNFNENNNCSDTRTTLRRKSEVEVNGKATKKRHKPYDSSAKPNRVLREGSSSSAPSPSVGHSPVPPTRASTPASLLHKVSSLDSPPASQPPPLHYPMQGSESSSPDSIATPLDHNPDVLMRHIAFEIPDSQPEHQAQPNSLLRPPVNALPSDLSLANLALSLPFLSMDPNQGTQPLQVQMPIIHRLIPNSGPTFGGIEVTVLGANFHPTMPLACVFGDVTAASTHRWSDNTLVCVLPARATAGLVPVWFEGFPKENDTPLFAYTDDSDRALMELALQVVGLKMTGKIEDAKNVAMRIVGNTGNDNSESSNNPSNPEVMQMSSTRDLRPLLLTRADQLNPFENRIIDLLSVLDTPLGSYAPNSISTLNAILHSTPSGQTLLHIAAFLGLGSLTRFLIDHGADLDARDRTGFTPLHFAVLAQSRQCTSALIQAGADLEIVDSRGKTAEEIEPEFFSSVIRDRQDDADTDDDYCDDEDADLGDAEEDADVELRHIMQRRISRKPNRRHNSSGKVTPLRSANISRAATPPLPGSDEKMKRPDLDKKVDSDVNDEKRAASFMEKMLAQIPARPGINIPQLPLPDLSAMPWATLPHIPVVFPVYVPIHWPSFRGAHQNSESTGAKTDSDNDEATKNRAGVALRTALEWRATWEKWVALAVATTARQQTEDVPPPIYTPRADGEVQAVESTSVELQEQAVASTSRRPHPDTRPVGYDGIIVPEQVVESFAYQPQAKQGRRIRKKRDLMLLLFWLPILLLSIVWAFHHGVRVVFQVVKTVFPPKNVRT